MPTSTDCIDSELGSENGDGYVRVLDKPRSKGGRLVMRHRLEWENVYGGIPEGYEINHLCKNRRCFNLDHLECLPKSEHRSKDNRDRYKPRELKILCYIERNPKALQREVGELFGVTQSCISNIIKRNKLN